MNAFFHFFQEYRDAIVFSTVLLAGYAGAITNKEILKDRFKATHARYVDKGNVVMCYRCWEPYPCADLKILGVKK